MPVLTTSRLTCSPLQEHDWPFYLSLQQHPDVMRYVGDKRPVADIRAAFEPRLQPWMPGSAHWLCLVVRDAQSQTPLGMTDTFIEKMIVQKWVSCSLLKLREKDMGTSRYVRCVILPLNRAEFAV